MSRSTARRRRVLVHLVRVAMFVAIVLLIHFQHQKYLDQSAGLDNTNAPDLTVIQTIVPDISSVGTTSNDGIVSLADDSGRTVGFALHTSPMADHIIGFSGPTNLLVILDNDRSIVAVKILNSRDTRDHVNQVRNDKSFLESMIGYSPSSIAQLSGVDSVSGATLTSLAIKNSIAHRIAGKAPKPQFDGPLDLELIRKAFPNADKLLAIEDDSSWFYVYDQTGSQMGSVLRTSPASDQVSGYQGPTDTLICLNRQSEVIRLLIGKSFDNSPYTGYVRDDDYFLESFAGLDLEKLAEAETGVGSIEGVSGATMTSQAVARSAMLAARKRLQQESVIKGHSKSNSVNSNRLRISIRDFGTVSVVVFGLILGFTSLRSKKWIRLVFQLVLIIYLGFLNGDFLSQALLVGWAQNGIPWRLAFGLVFLSCAALLLPITSKRNVYCNQICPHGAVQQMVKRRLPWQVKLSKQISRILGWLPVALITWCLLVALLHLPFSLVDVEPFDAWIIRVAGWSTIIIALFGLIASLFVPMAYCRFGCPTGLLLRYLRFNAASDRWTSRDWLMLTFVLFATFIFVSAA